MSNVDKSSSIHCVSSIDEKLREIKKHQRTLTNSVVAFNRSVSYQSVWDQSNSLKRLRLDLPPGWTVNTRIKNRAQLIFEVRFEEKSRRREAAVRQLDGIHSLNIGSDQRLSNYLNRHVVIPFKCQSFPGIWSKQSRRFTLIGLKPEAWKNIIKELSLILMNPVYCLPPNSLTDTAQKQRCDDMVEDLLKQVKKNALPCVVVAIEADQFTRKDYASELFTEISAQFSEEGYRAIVLIMHSGDSELSALAETGEVPCHWVDQRPDAKQIISAQESQSALVVELNTLARETFNDGGGLVQAINNVGCEPGWQIATRRQNSKEQISGMLFDETNMFLSKISLMKDSPRFAKCLSRPTMAELIDFLDKQVVMSFKNQKSYKTFGMSNEMMPCVFCVPSIEYRSTITDILSLILGYPVYQLPREPEEDDNMEQPITADQMIRQLVKAVKKMDLGCPVVAIEVDKLKAGICAAELFKLMKAQLVSAGYRAIVLIMCSCESGLAGLPKDMERFYMGVIIQGKKVTLQGKTRTADKIHWYLLNKIAQSCSGNGIESEGIDWKKAAEKLANKIPRAMADDSNTTDPDIEKACHKVAVTYAVQLRKYCANHGLIQVTQDAVEQCAIEVVEKAPRKLDKVIENFTLPGQPKLMEFFRSQVIELLVNPEFYEKYGINFPGSFLLYGPPGTGKTHALQKLAAFSGLAFFEMNPNTVGSRYVDQCEQNIARMFDEAASENGAIIFIDEIDSMLPNRTAVPDYGVKRTNELLRHIEQAQENRILVVGATNRLDALDPAAVRKGRLGETFEVGWLDADGIAELLDVSLKKYVDEDTALDVKRAAEYLGSTCLLAGVYAFIERLRTYAASQKLYPLTQKILDQYLHSLEESGVVKKHSTA